MKNLTLLIPAKEESESLPIFLDEIKYLNVNKLIVLQKEDLITQEVIKNFSGIRILEQSSNGYGNAIKEGIASIKTEFLCIINADGSMNPEYLQSMLSLCNDKDFVFASRYQDKNSGSDDDNFITLLGNKFFSRVGNIFFRLNISDILFTYILGKTSSFKNLQLQYNDFSICVELPIKVKKKNYNYVTISSFERKRIAGKKKVNAFKDGVLILYAMIKLFIEMIVIKK
jgi:hypothetical protein